MTISDRIFERLNALGMTQKVFSELTGVKPSTISEWKTKGKNPSSEKILPICMALDVTPEWLLSGVDKAGKRGSEQEYLVIYKDSDIGIMIEQYKSLDVNTRSYIMGYIAAFMAMKDKDKV